MKTITIEKLEREIQQLPSLSVVVMELLQLIDRGEVEFSLLDQKINQDQALAARVLRVANSPFYGFAGHIGTVREACVVLGVYTVRNIVMAAGIIDRFPPDESSNFDRLGFWQHAVGTGVAARVFASHCGQDPNIAFTAGLLHDIGKLVLDAHFPDVFHDILQTRDKMDCLLREAEMQQLGFDHTVIGARVAEQWKLPPMIIEAIKNHHQPDTGPASAIVDLIHLSDIICRAMEIGDGGDTLIPRLVPSILPRLGLSWDKIRDQLPEVEELNASTNILIGDPAG